RPSRLGGGQSAKSGCTSLGGSGPVRRWLSTLAESVSIERRPPAGVERRWDRRSCETEVRSHLGRRLGRSPPPSAGELAEPRAGYADRWWSIPGDGARIGDRSRSSRSSGAWPSCSTSER